MDLDRVRQLFESLKEKIQTTQDLEKLRQTFLGKKGYITQLFKELRNAKPEERRELGKLINTLREEIEEFIKLKGEELKRKELEEKLKAER